MQIYAAIVPLKSYDSKTLERPRVIRKCKSANSQPRVALVAKELQSKMQNRRKRRKKMRKISTTTRSIRTKSCEVSNG